MSLSLFHLHGDLKDLRFPRLLAALREDRFTGVFQATTAGGDAGDGAEITREVHFLEGRIAWAISTEKEEGLRAYMVRNGTLTAARWAQAEQQARGGTVRDALVSLGMVDPRELTQIEKGRAEEILLTLFSAHEGEYRVRERQLSPGTPDLRIDPRALILKGVLERGDQGLVLEEVGSLDTVFAPRRQAPEEEAQILPGEFQSVLMHIDGRRSIAQICSLTSLPDNFVCSVVAALSMIGAVKRHQERSPSMGRAGIVKDAEVATGPKEQEAPGPVPLPEELADVEESLAEQLDLTETAEPAAVPHASPRAVPRVEPLPPISERPFTSMASPADLSDESEDDLLVEDPIEEILAPEPLDDQGSIYAGPARQDTSRPWFILGGGAAVGFAALFLILMGQNTGDAGEVIRPVSEAVPGAAMQNLDNTDNADNPDIADRSQAAPAPIPTPVAPPPEAAILKRNVSSEHGARESLQAGDYVAAAREFGREVSRASGGYTIQLMAACQDSTIRKAVEHAGGASSLFILSTRVDGRSCYRVYWGRYPTLTRAREALRRDVPQPFLRDRGRQPRVTRLGGA
ncbi:MAG TPA: DUF4388 domain-containing protein [Candidatus Polarisedimenticolia bacterium]|jgi:hypothetical protein